MSDNLKDLLENDFFGSNPTDLVEFVNRKFSKNLTKSLEEILVEIDDALESNYVKRQRERFDQIDRKSRETLEEIGDTLNDLERVKERGFNINNQSIEIIDCVDKDLRKINDLQEKYRDREKEEYLMEIISTIQSSLILDDINLACEYLINLIKSLESFKIDSSKKRQKTIFQKLKDYHQLVSQELYKQFQECLKEIGWPYISNNLQATNLELSLEKITPVSARFSSTFRQLFLIQIPEEMDTEVERKVFINTKFTTNLDRIPLPVEILLEQLVKYFKFFFWTDNKINKISKPEWYMAQVIQWIMVHHTVLGEIFTEDVLELVDGRLEFIRGLVILVMEKVQKDFEIILKKSNEDLFFHLIEEALSMTVDLRKNFDYPRNYPDPIDIICSSNEIFDNWMKLEQRFASKQLDEVFRSPTSWQGLSKTCKRVECLNSFIGLISAMKDRIQCIFDISKQTRFSEVLLEVLDDFRRRLLQISKDYNANSQRWYDIMNVVYSIKILLRNWRLDQMFISIYESMETNEKISEETDESLLNISSIMNLRPYRVASFSSSSLYSSRTKTMENFKLSKDSIFSSVLSLYQHLLEEMEEECVEAAFEEVSERADSYIKTSWLEIGSVSTPRLMSLSPSASGMLLVLRDRLYGLQLSLEEELFEYIWQGLAVKLNKMIFDYVIRPHRFNELGASQLDFDLRKNLLPLFLPYTKSPERFFIKCLEACVLLNLKCGTAILIKQILTETLHNKNQGLFTRSRPECPIRTLTEIGVVSLIPEEADSILNLRIDINLKP